MRRVVITGMGIVSCLGQDLDSVAASLKEGKSGIRFNPSYAEMGLRSHVSGSVDIDLEAAIDRKVKRFMGDAAAYAYLSMQQAIADATYKPGAAIELSVADDLSEQCLAMPPALAIAALRNLLENARRHTRPGTQVDLHIARDGQGRVRFSIRDQGPGIPPERL